MKPMFQTTNQISCAPENREVLVGFVWKFHVASLNATSNQWIIGNPYIINIDNREFLIIGVLIPFHQCFKGFFYRKPLYYLYLMGKTGKTGKTMVSSRFPLQPIQ